MSAMWNNIVSGSALEQTTVDSFDAPMTILTEPEQPFSDFGNDIIINTDSDDTLIAITGPQGTLADIADDINKVTIDDQTIYIVREGDTIGSIASLFDLKVDTIRNANNLGSKSISVEQKLIIPPGDGILYTVQKGDSLRSIAKKFSVESQDIMDFNYILDASSIVIGQKIFIPGGKTLPVIISKKHGRKSSGGATINFSGSFVRPANGTTTSQFGIRRGEMHEGLDFSAHIGTPIYASESGIIQARYGYNGGYGNLIVIKHGQGVETRYAHLSSIAVSTGSHVNKGDLIGYSGNTGRSTGPHLHFEIRQNGRAVNPAKYLP